MTSDQQGTMQTSVDKFTSASGGGSTRGIKSFFRRKQKSSQRGGSNEEPVCNEGELSPNADVITSPLTSQTIVHAPYGNYYTVSGTSAGVLHDQFSRRFLPLSSSGRASKNSRLRRSAGGTLPAGSCSGTGQGTTQVAGVLEEAETVACSKDDDGTVSAGGRRLRGVFRWRHKSAPEHTMNASTAAAAAVLPDDERPRKFLRGGGSLTGSAAGRMRTWLDSFRQRSKSEGIGADSASLDGQLASAATTSGSSSFFYSSASRSKRKKFKVTPAVSSDCAERGVVDEISAAEFTEMVRNRSNSDPCFEAWLKAKATVSRSRKLSDEGSRSKGHTERRQQMVIWRDKKRGTKVFRLPRTCEEQPTIEGSQDDGSDELTFARLMNRTRCYDLMPSGSKLVVFDTQLTVKKAFFALVANGVHAAPLWDANRHDFVGMLTITDFIQILQKYYKSPQERMDEVEEHKIATWREVLCENDRPMVQVDPDDSLLTTMRRLHDSHVHRVLVVDSEKGNALHILTHKRILKFLYSHMHQVQPSFMNRTLEELHIGTYEDIATATLDMPVIQALNIFVERSISALPIVDSNGRVVDVYAKFDVIGLAEEKLYNNLDVTLSTALATRREGFEGVHICRKSETLLEVVERIVRAEVHRLIVVDEANVVQGVVSLSDILHYLVFVPLDELKLASEIQPTDITQELEQMTSIELEEGPSTIDQFTMSLDSQPSDMCAASSGDCELASDGVCSEVDALLLDIANSNEAAASQQQLLECQMILLMSDSLNQLLPNVDATEDLENKVLDVSKDDVDDFQVEVDWQRMQLMSEMEVGGTCGLP